jgi:hypothetical protein
MAAVRRCRRQKGMNDVAVAYALGAGADEFALIAAGVAVEVGPAIPNVAT